MSTSVTSVVSHFPSAQNGFTTTLGSTISSGAVTVPLNSVAGYTNGQIAVMVVDPTDSAKKQTFTGTVDTSGVQLTSVVWTAGTNQAHTGGSTVVDYATATHISMVSKGILVEHAQAGTHAAATITSRTEDTSPASGDFLLTYDISATALKKVTAANLATLLLGLSPAWSSYTPTFTNVTVGNGTLACKYIQIGKTIHVRISLIFGSGTSTSGDIIFTLPITSVSYPGTSGVPPLGVGRGFDTSASLVFNSDINWVSTTTANMRFYNTGVAVSVQFLNTGSAPTTWGTGDEFTATFTYEAA